jgi:hypothetical protein
MDVGKRAAASVGLVLPQAEPGAAVYDACMHRWLLIFMIALLPLRGWVGDAMAAQMLQQSLATVEAAAAPSHHATPVAHDDCMGHAGAADASSAASGSDTTAVSHSDCPTCASCQVCSSAAVAMNTVSLQPLAFEAPAPSFFAARFASAEPAPALKPPIS